MANRTFEMSCNAGAYPLEITPDDRGVIDGGARTVFTRGQCHALAYALHAQTGWPIHLLTYDRVDPPVDDDDDLPLESWDHAVVRHPDGRFVDINGAWHLDASDWSRRYGLSHTVEVSAEYVAEHASRDYHMAYFEDLPTTDAFARSVIESL
jgi:hypothetical protein